MPQYKSRPFADNTENLHGRREIIQDIRDEPQMYSLWNNYTADNKNTGDLQSDDVLETVNETAELLDL